MISSGGSHHIPVKTGLYPENAVIRSATGVLDEQRVLSRKCLFENLRVL
jgi:hypothetical protein